MEFVMVQEIVYVMIIGIQKQIALVCSKFIQPYQSYIVSLKKILAEFLCEDDGDCNGKGACVDSKCDCVPGWDSSFDCHGEYLVH